MPGNDTAGGAAAPWHDPGSVQRFTARSLAVVLEQLSPRLTAARALHAEGRVRPIDGGFEVRSGERTYLVHRRADGTWGCTCPWWGEHHGDRGPCKHVLATTQVAR